jgi:alkaline phosphatase
MSIIGLVDTTVPGSIQNVRSNTPYPATGAPPPAGAGGSNPGETGGFPNYEDVNSDRYPENTNRYKIAVGYRTGNHTGSSVPITAEGAGALLFFGYFDQTDIFFKMARALSMNTKPLDNAVEQKTQSDVPRFNPPPQLRHEGNSLPILATPNH